MGTHVLKITDGTTTIDLAAGNQYLVDYKPLAPEISTVDYTPESMLDGGERPMTTRRNVTESAKVMFKDTTTDAIRATIRSLEDLLREAERQQTTRQMPAVYVQFQPGSAGTVYQSEILSGKVELEDALSAGAWGGKQIMVTVSWTRRYYWAETTLTAIPITNANGTGVTTGLAIYNHDDSGTGHDNHVSIAANVIAGAIPAPVDISFANTLNTTDNPIDTLIIGANVFGSPTTYSPWLEGEDGTASSLATKTTSSNVLYSNGSAGNFAWTSSSEVSLAYWTLGANQIAYGNWVRVIARMTPNATGTSYNTHKFRIKVTYEGFAASQLLYTGQQIFSDSRIQYHDFGSFRLPPWIGVKGIDSPNLALRLYGEISGGGNVTVDWIMLVPTDGIRKYEARGNLPYNAVLRDMTHQERNVVVADTLTTSYRAAASMKAVGGIIATGNPLLVWPNRAHKFYFLWSNYLGNGDKMVCDHTATVWLHYAPRRLTF